MAKKKTIIIDGTPFGAFNVLKDSKWHTAEELREKCGNNGPRRARDLRSTKYGSFVVENKVENGVSKYRIPKESLVGKDVEISIIESRETLSEPHEIDKERPVMLTGMDRVFILAMLTGSSQLNDPTVKKLWIQRRAQLIYRFKRSLPAGLIDPFDLFEEDES